MREHDTLLRAIKATARLADFKLARASITDDTKITRIGIILEADSSGIVQDELPLSPKEIEYKVGEDGVVQVLVDGVPAGAKNGDLPEGSLAETAAEVAAEAPLA